LSCDHPLLHHLQVKEQSAQALLMTYGKLKNMQLVTLFAVILSKGFEVVYLLNKGGKPHQSIELWPPLFT
jgi:hypothetical protein